MVFTDAIRRPGKFELVKHLLGDKTTELMIMGSGIEGINILDLAARCGNLKTLLLRGMRIDSWPIFPRPWTSNLHLTTT